MKNLTLIILIFIFCFGCNQDQSSVERLPVGTVLAWSPKAAGTTVIPTGFKVCNGKDGTPNLINRFVMGAETGTADQAGGSSDHTHEFGQTTRDLAPDASGNTSGSFTKPANHLPPFYSLVYIVKVEE